MESQKNVLSILVNNKLDVLARISGTFSGRNINIESISANITMDPERTRIIITAMGDNAAMEKIVKQIAKLVDVIEARNLAGIMAVTREMVLVRLDWSKRENRREIEMLAERKGWKILSADERNCILEITGENGLLMEEVMGLHRFGLEDFTRTGVVAIEKGV
jgi:acetolactate synthase-1/3 small subunit